MPVEFISLKLILLLVCNILTRASFVARYFFEVKVTIEKLLRIKLGYSRELEAGIIRRDILNSSAFKPHHFAFKGV